MKSLASLSTTAKVGGASVLGGTGIAGTGILIHNQLKFRLIGLDLELVNDSGATLAIKSDNSKISVTSNTATLEIKATSSVDQNKFKEENSVPKWTCVVKGIAKERGQDVSLSTTTGSETFKIDDQTSKFSSKLSSHKEGFVKSCARNRTKQQWESKTSPLTSEIRVELIKNTAGENKDKWEFSTKAIEDIFSGNWINKADQ